MSKGYFGNYGGRFAPELLMPPLLELEDAVENILPSGDFQNEFRDILENYVGRPTPLTYCSNASRALGFNLWLKREDLAHTGAHKINNTIGQALLAKYMGKFCLVAETGAGQHGVATATAASLLNLDCIVYMGARDIERQASNVRRMELLGAEVRNVQTSTQTLKDAINAALRHWIASQQSTHYCLGSVVGPHPFPLLVRELQTTIGRETREQFLLKNGKLPDHIIASVGGGSNALGIFYPFISDTKVALTGVEAAGSDLPGDYHSATVNLGTPGVLHGTLTRLLQTREGQILPSHSVAPGLDYPGVGPEHCYFSESGRISYRTANDRECLEGFKFLSRKEGIIPALESSHAIAEVIKQKDNFSREAQIVVNLSGRGDKDLGIYFEMESQE